MSAVTTRDPSAAKVRATYLPTPCGAGDHDDLVFERHSQVLLSRLQVLFEEVKRALPGQLGRLRPVPRARIVEKRVERILVEVVGEVLAGLLHRRLQLRGELVAH